MKMWVSLLEKKLTKSSKTIIEEKYFLSLSIFLICKRFGVAAQNRIRK